jgi:hypothetical protein
MARQGPSGPSQGNAGARKEEDGEEDDEEEEEEEEEEEVKPKKPAPNKEARMSPALELAQPKKKKGIFGKKK